MKRSHRIGIEMSLTLVVLVLLLVLLFLPLGGAASSVLWFVLIGVVFLWMLWLVLAGTREAEERAARVERRVLGPEEQPSEVREVMDIYVAVAEPGVVVFRGPLREPPETVYARLKERFGDRVVPLLQQDEQFESALVLMEKPVEERRLERPSRPWVNWLLFGLTFITTTWAGATHQGIDLLSEPMRVWAGLPYSVALMAILGFHELGHFYFARRHGMRVTPPYFIPVPFALGTFGAFIQMKSPPESRRALFDMAVAGPLAGLVLAVPALMAGLQTSEVIVPEAGEAASPMLTGHGASVGSSVLFALLAKAAIPEALEFGCILRLSPLAFAGWLGLFVTALNLLPIGQLDGGHIARSMFGTRTGHTISSVAMWSLLLLAIFVWPSLLFFAILVFFLAGQGSPPLNDLTPISPARRWLGFFSFLILAAILLPLPRAFWSAVGIFCPYV